MQEALYQTADARDSLSDSGCKRLYIRQREEEFRKQGCKKLLRDRRDKMSLGNKDAEQLLRVRRVKKSLGNKDVEQLLRVRRDKKS